jgi:hypothetical protein
MFLYILKLPKYNCIKIGVAKNYSRIKQHLNTYEEINLEESYVVHATNGDTIRQLEKQLLEDYIEYKIENERLMDKDGYTELRKEEILNDVLEDIRYKANKFQNKGINIIEGIEVKKDEKKKKETNIKTTKKYIQKSLSKRENLVKDIDISNRNFIYKENNYMIPETMIFYPMFRCEYKNIPYFEYKFLDFKVKCSNNIDNEIITGYDFTVFMCIIQIYLEDKKLYDLSELNVDDNTVKISFYKMCQIMYNKNTSMNTINILKNSINRLSNTKISIYNKEELVSNFNIITKNYIDINNKYIEINKIFLKEIKDKKILSLDIDITNNIKSKYTLRMLCLFKYLIGRKEKIEINLLDLEDMIGCDANKYNIIAKITRALEELKTLSLIKSFEVNAKDKRVIIFRKNK